MKLMWLLVGLVLGGCEAKQTEYHFACYTYQEQSELKRTVVEYPCKITQEYRSAPGLLDWAERRP